MKIDELKKVKQCPFCGADEGFLTMVIADRDACLVKCCNCGGSSGVCETSEEAVAAWESRAGNAEEVRQFAKYLISKGKNGVIYTMDICDYTVEFNEKNGG